MCLLWIHCLVRELDNLDGGVRTIPVLAEDRALGPTPATGLLSPLVGERLDLVGVRGRDLDDLDE